MGILLIFAKRHSLELLKIGFVLGLFLPNSISLAKAESTRNHSIRINQPSLSKENNPQQSNLKRAIALGKKSAATYHHQNQKTKEIETLLKISQGYISLGEYRSAISELEKVMLKASSNETLAITETRLGNAYSGIGNFKKAEKLYKSSLKKEIDVATLINLVKVLKIQEQSSSSKAENGLYEIKITKPILFIVWLNNQQW